MTTSDLITEALIRFRQEILAECKLAARLEVKRELDRRLAKGEVKPHFITKPSAVLQDQQEGNESESRV